MDKWVFSISVGWDVNIETCSSLHCPVYQQELQPAELRKWKKAGGILGGPSPGPVHTFNRWKKNYAKRMERLSLKGPGLADLERSRIYLGTQEGQVQYSSNFGTELCCL
ncbi:Hypothetical predicted protein [Podarcis lilfordi]|uniref:Uncharacterized protein n=1 Tax=Podarcis lilfordi TaxID=74358 RepID=A0AA35LH82_9SAUR|nr:Hypothetical predicted protein [Podarcis lilfordi]